MNWVEQKSQTRENVEVTEAKAKLLNEAKKELPVVQKEADGGVRPFQAIAFTPIQGVGKFEAEFGVKGDDVIFHFWPWGYHTKEREGSRLPSFEKVLDSVIKEEFPKAFGSAVTIETEFDGDVGAWFVKAKNAALNQFHSKLSVKAVSNLYVALGGVLEES